MVVGSEEDKYVPGYSSCMQYEGQNARIIAMQKSLEERIANLHRISVTFDKKIEETIGKGFQAEESTSIS